MFQKLHDTAPAVTIQVDGVPIVAQADETVAAVILRQQQVWTRTTPMSGSRRAPYCMMGVCFDCLAEVDGITVQTCMTIVQEGMVVMRQQRRRSLA